MDLSDSESGDPLSSSRPQNAPSSSKATKPQLPVVCRVKRSLWWIVWLGLFEAAFMLSAPLIPDKQHPGANLWAMAIITFPVGLFMAAGVVGIALELLRAEIRADGEGLRWRRGFGGWKEARWEEISDFYQKYARPPITGVVETPAGELKLSPSFEGIDHVMELVSEKAVNAPARTWEAQGHRAEEEWTKTLSPWTKVEKWFAPIMTCLPLAFAVALGGVFLGPKNQSPVSLGFWADTASLLLALLLFGSLLGVSVWMVAILWKERQFAWEHRDETVVLSARGVVFSSASERIEARWEEVKGVTRLPKIGVLQPIRIETTPGDFVVWRGPNMTMWSQMSPLIGQYAPDALKPIEEMGRRETQQLDDLEGEHGAWSGGEIGVGARRWSYRARETRALLLCATLFVALGPLIYLQRQYTLSLQGSEFRPSWSLFAGLCSLSALVIGAVWAWYMRAAVWADENGLEIRSPFHPTYRASWGSVEGLGKDAFGEFVRANGRRLYLSRLFSPVRCAELREYIEQKVGGAR